MEACEMEGEAVVAEEYGDDDEAVCPARSIASRPLSTPSRRPTQSKPIGRWHKTIGPLQWEGSVGLPGRRQRQRARAEKRACRRWS